MYPSITFVPFKNLTSFQPKLFSGRRRERLNKTHCLSYLEVRCGAHIIQALFICLFVFFFHVKTAQWVLWHIYQGFFFVCFFKSLCRPHPRWWLYSKRVSVPRLLMCGTKFYGMVKSRGSHRDVRCARRPAEIFKSLSWHHRFGLAAGRRRREETVGDETISGQTGCYATHHLPDRRHTTFIQCCTCSL